jgi:hypothetical protein
VAGLAVGLEQAAVGDLLSEDVVEAELSDSAAGLSVEEPAALELGQVLVEPLGRGQGAEVGQQEALAEHGGLGYLARKRLASSKLCFAASSA